MDPLDKAFTVWLSPPNGTTRPKPIHRRLDLIFAPRKYYACAVLGWSGSTSMSGLISFGVLGNIASLKFHLFFFPSIAFERDLRLYAEKNKG